MLKLTVLASKNTDSNGQFFNELKLKTKLTCNAGQIMSVKFSETHEERQNKSLTVKKVEILTVVKTGKIVVTYACDRIG